jgi:ribosomal peptide maturation radical SAM protein 1
LLKAELAAYGHRVDVHYLNLDLSARLGAGIYEAIWSLPGERQSLLGDWLFTHSAYQAPLRHPDVTEYLERYQESIGSLESKGVTAAGLRALHADVLPRWIDELAGTVRWDKYDIVGFSSTFAQNVAAIALARQIKARYPQVTTLFGGANFDGEMGPEYVRAFPEIDCAVSGEGDLVVPVLVARLSHGRPLPGLQGVTARTAEGHVVPGGQAPKVVNMDDLPDPDYADYFSALERLGHEAVPAGHHPALLFEASRGCWWGEKHHCTFCGLNAQGMAYRSKSPDRMVRELASLAGRYRVLTMAAVDNILDMRYLKSVCAELCEARWDLRMFFEVKANLSRDQIKALRDAGITQLQPGLESLSSNVLQLMRKGSTMLTNVRLLKWCRYYKMHVSWNILCGFPGEVDADYEEQIQLIPALLHLMPPGGVGPIWIERFSPYFTGEFPIFDVEPQDAYDYVYPASRIDLRRIAYFFKYRIENVSSDDVRLKLSAAVEEWQQSWSGKSRPTLDYQRGSDWIAITDSRTPHLRHFTFEDWRVAAYECCSDKPHTVDRIYDQLTSSGAATPGCGQLAEFLDSCVADQLMVCENGKFFSLALPQNGNW